MSKKKKSKKLTECEEKAIVALEAKRIREKEQKQKTREKRKRENENTGVNKKIALGGQVLPFQSGIQATVPVQIYESYPLSKPFSFEEQFLRPAAAQAPAALQAYLFMNSGQHRERLDVQRRNKAVQAGGNRVGGNNNVNLLNVPSSNVRELRSNIEKNVPGPWFFDPSANLDRSTFDPKLEPSMVRKRKDVVKELKDLQAKERRAAAAAKSLLSLGQGRNIGPRGFSAIFSGAGDLAGSLSRSVMGGLNRFGDFLSGPSSKKTDAETQSLLGEDKQESDPVKPIDNESDLRNRNQLFNIFRDEDEKLSAEEIDEQKKNEIQLENRDKKSKLKKAILENTGVGKNFFRDNVLEEQSVSVTRYNEPLVNIGSSKWGVHSSGYVVDQLTGKFLHPNYKERNIQPPDEFIHYDDRSYQKMKKQFKDADEQARTNFKNILNLDDINEFIPPLSPIVKQEEKQSEVELIPNTFSSNQQNVNLNNPEDYRMRTIIPNTGLNESNNESFMQRYGNGNVSFESGAFVGGGSEPIELQPFD
jgi:hypothetical protein